MNLGSIYLITRDFASSVGFYEKFLGIPVTKLSSDRFAQFIFHGNNLSLMNGLYDRENPDKVVRQGVYSAMYDDAYAISQAPNSRKIVMNFFEQDLRSAYERILSLELSEYLTKVRYIYTSAPYYYFSLCDPDGNIIEVTGLYEPTQGEFD